MVLSGEYYDVFFVTQLTRATALAHIVAVDRVRVEPERHSQTHRHNDAETVLFIESGSGTVVINTIEHFVTAGDRLCITRGAWHSVIRGARRSFLHQSSLHRSTMMLRVGTTWNSKRIEKALSTC